MAAGECSKFAGILNAALSQDHLLGFALYLRFTHNFIFPNLPHVVFLMFLLLLKKSHNMKHPVLTISNCTIQ